MSDDAIIDLVDRVSVALVNKLQDAEQKFGYNDDWKKGDWEKECQEKLTQAVQKGDPLDVIAYASFCWDRGWTTSCDFVYLNNDQQKLLQSISANSRTLPVSE